MRPPPHGVLEIELPEGVGRLDHCAMPDKVREDAVELMAISLAGSRTLAPDMLISWLLGKHMADPDDERRMLICRQIARHHWEFAVESCGGFALGVRDEDGQLGGLALAMPRGDSGCVTRVIERQTANYMAGKFPWNKLGTATNGIHQRYKAFEKTRRERLKINVPHIHLNHLRVNSQAKSRDLEIKLAMAVSYYADRRGLPVFHLAAGMESGKLFMDKCGFVVRDQFEVHATADPDKSSAMPEMMALFREPQDPRRRQGPVNTSQFEPVNTRRTKEMSDVES